VNWWPARPLVARVDGGRPRRSARRSHGFRRSALHFVTSGRRKTEGSCTPRAATRAAHLTAKYVFDLRDDDIYWCTADMVGNGHSYVVYGRCRTGATVLMYEGRRTGRIFRASGRSSMTTRYDFYTAPTAIRAFIKWAEFWEKYKLDSLRLLGTVGEPINPRHVWYREKMATSAAIVTMWQTEEPGAINELRRFRARCRPARARRRGPSWHSARGGDEAGCEWPFWKGPAAARGCWWCASRGGMGAYDLRRFPSLRKNLWSDVPGCTSRRRRRQDADGYFWLMGPLAT